MVGKVPAFQPRGLGSIPVGLGILISILGLVVCSLSVLSCVVSGGGPDILLTTDSGRPASVVLSSVLVYNLWLS